MDNLNDDMDQAPIPSTSAVPIEPTQPASDRPSAPPPPPRHVQVAQRAMNEPHKETKPLGKPLNSLTTKDVAMTEESMAEVS